jgi:tetratricopeptide (TPR) repeat protein
MARTQSIFLSAMMLVCSASRASAQGAPAVDPIASLADAARRAPRDAAALRRYGMALLGVGRFREATAELRRAAAASGNTPESLYDVARVAFAEGDDRKAQAACARIPRSPENVLRHVCNARAALVVNRASLAFEAITAAERLDPHHFEAQMARGDAHRMSGDPALAREAYRHAIRTDAYAPEPYVALGRLAIAGENADEAREQFRLALEHDPTSAEAAFELGQMLASGPEAERLLGVAARSRSTSAEVQAAYGDVLLANGNPEAAERAFALAISLTPTLARAYAGLGRAKAARGDLPGAEADLRKAVELVPNSALFVRTLAEIVARAGRPDDALSLYRQAAGLDSQDPSIYLAATRLALDLQRDVLAAAFLDRLLRQFPSNATALTLYGDVMKARGNRTEARAFYERALATGEFPERAYVEEQLRTLPAR